MTELFDMGCFATEFTDDAFDEFAMSNQLYNETDEQHNYCSDCQLPMELAGCEYSCPECGLTKFNEPSTNKNDVAPATIRVSTGASRGRYYNVAGDYTKAQRAVIYKQLTNQATLTQYKGPAIPTNVLNSVATKYNILQKTVTEDELDECGIACGKKKFVRRSSNKDEILAALIYFECNIKNVVRKKGDVAMFMGLQSRGFSRGEELLRDLKDEGKIDFDLAEESTRSFVEKYMEALNLENPKYNQFVIDLVEESDKRMIGMGSQLSSKIVGAIWIVIVKCKLAISDTMLEKAADNTKKNTFIKFYNIVLERINIFAHIFSKHGIPK